MALLIDRKIINAEKKSGGKGHVIIEPLLSEKELNNKCDLYAQVTLEPGCSIGYHEHHGNTETYYILQGSGLYSDNGKELSIKAGDTTYCPNGEGHSIENNASAGNLIFMALIIKE
jgi:mannose-6-phosphate isomerase-like protein (cupin superfamily)